MPCATSRCRSLLIASLCCGAVPGFVLALGTPVHAALEFVSDDASQVWPAEAPVRTSAFVTQASTRGVRGDRFQYQTFEVAVPFSLDRILIEYGWVGGTAGGSVETNFTKVRLVEVERTFNELDIETSLTLGNEIIPAVAFAHSPTDAFGDPKVVNAFYAIELAWDSSVSGPLVLQPRTGNQAYAIEINGTHVGAGSSAINLIERGTNPYPFGRAYEFQPTRPGFGGGATGPFGNGLYDFPLVLTAVSSPGLDGDFNGDGVVDAADYVVWRTTLGDDANYKLWRNNFGAMSSDGESAAASFVAAPEPTAVVLVCLAAYFCVASRRFGNMWQLRATVRANA
jgi:hypothetical protein